MKLDGLGKAPANNLGNSILGLLGGGEGAAAGAGGILGAALPLILGALGLGGGGGGASAGFLPGLNSLISIDVPDAKIDIHGNYVTDSGNPNVEVKDNTATATVDVRDNGRDNNTFVEAPVNANVTDNVKGDIKALESLGGGGGSSSKNSKDSKISKVSTGGSKVATTGN